MFPIAELVPTDQALTDDPERAVQPFLSWASANRELIARGPIDHLLTELSWRFRNKQFKRIVSPLLGTYRLTLSVPGADDRVFFARTGREPYTDWYERSARTINSDHTHFTPVAGYHLLVVLAKNADALGSGCGTTTSKISADIANTDSSDVRTWRGLIDWEIVELMFPRDSALTAYSQSWKQGYARRLFKEEQAPARFFTLPTGTMQIRAEYPIDENRRAILHGERISPDVSRCGSR